MNTVELKEFISQLVKAKKTLRLYPENNPVYEKTVDSIYQSLLGLLEYQDAIVLKFKQYEIFSDGELLYQNTDKHESFAMFFFKDGLRELKFLKGIPKEEFADFLRIISMDFEREVVDDDVVTLMWERDFQYIQYVVDENLLFADEELYDESEIERVKGITTEEEILKAYRDAFENRPSRSSDVTIISLTNEDVRKIVEELDKSQIEAFNKFVNLLFEMLHLADNMSDVSYIQKVFKETLDMAMDRARVDVVFNAYKRIASAVKSKEYSKEVLAVLIGVVNHINSKDFIEIFGHTLEDGVQYERQEIEALSRVFDKRSVEYLLELLGNLEDMNARKTLLRLMVLVGQKNIDALIKKLTDRRWYLVRNVIYILREIGDKKAAQHIAPLIKHGDIRVRKLAIETVGDFRYSNALPLLRETLHDENEAVRIATVRALAKIHTEASKSMILDEINDKTFLRKSEEERKEFFKAIATWHDDEEVKRFIMMVLKKKSFFVRARLNQMKTLAAHAAGLMMLKEAEDILKNLSRNKDHRLREESLEALKRIRYARR